MHENANIHIVSNTDECTLACTLIYDVDANLSQVTTNNTIIKRQVLKSGKSQEEMEEEFAFGPLEEVHAATRGELELIKTLGKSWFDAPVEGAKA
jgi:hypothetical protein